MGEVEFHNKDDEYKVKIADGGDFKEPGGGIRKPSQEEIDEYKIHRIVIMVIFGLVVVVLLLLIIILIATTEGCVAVHEEKLPWYKSGVIYNIYPRSFKDSNGDGIGDFKGIIEKLNHLQGLGVNILYLSSVFKIDKDVDYGYSVIDFKDTNDKYGTLADFEKLVEAAHDKSMKVIIEFVPCETSTKHQWFKHSSQDKNNTDWYVWNNTNISELAGSWSQDPDSKRFYLHPTNYSKKASLDWNSTEVKKELQSVLGFWLDKKVDGFSVVSVHRLFGEKPSSDDWKKINEVVQKWKNYTTNRNPESVLIGTSNPAHQDDYLGLYGTEQRPGLDIVININLVYNNRPESTDQFYTAANFAKLINKYIQQLKNGNWPSWALTSWIHGRVGSNVDSKLARSLQALLLTLPGTPIVFYGDEIGMQNVKSVGISPADINKSPMQWNVSKNGGFSWGPKTWFGAVGNASYTNAKHDPLGIAKKFKDAVKLRTDNATVLLNGSLANFTVVTNNKSVLAFTFEAKPPQYAIVMNFGNSVEDVDLSNKLGVKKGDLKYHTADKAPKETKMEALKVPAKVLYLFQVTERVKKS